MKLVSLFPLAWGGLFLSQSLILPGLVLGSENCVQAKEVDQAHDAEDADHRDDQVQWVVELAEVDWLHHLECPDE